MANKEIVAVKDVEADDVDFKVTVELEGGEEKTATVPAAAVLNRGLLEAKMGHPIQDDYGDLGRDVLYHLRTIMKAKGLTPKGLIRADELMLNDYPPLRFAVGSILPEGTAIIAGNPKVGKSWLALQLTLAVASGGAVLDQKTGKPRKVLHLALEDGERRIQSRITKLGGASPETLKNIEFATTWPPLDDGGLGMLRAYAQAEDPSLIIIDVLQKLRTPGKGANENAYERDYRHLSKLHAITKEHPGLCITCAHHFRKGQGEDFVESISGSYGLTGVVDTVIGLTRPRSAKTGTLESASRDASELAWRVSFDGSRWGYVGELEDEKSEADEDFEIACDFLREELAEGPVPTKTVEKDAREAGLSTSNRGWRRARKEVTESKKVDGGGFEMRIAALPVRGTR